MATIKQIAELAGVSRGTVDRVLNNRGSVNANTAARVREIAEKLNYKPNKAGLMLAAQKKNLKIGVILFPDSNPFFSEVLDSIKSKAQVWDITEEESMQPCLANPTVPNIERKYFWKCYKKHGLEYAVKRYCTPTLMNRIRRKIRKTLGLI